MVAGEQGCSSNRDHGRSPPSALHLGCGRVSSLLIISQSLNPKLLRRTRHWLIQVGDWGGAGNQEVAPGAGEPANDGISFAKGPNNARVDQTFNDRARLRASCPVLTALRWSSLVSTKRSYWPYAKEIEDARAGSSPRDRDGRHTRDFLSYH
ncbi:uncharacterized protein LY79DRAFT_556551, partial [Colletotrichum navitas]